MLFFFLVEIALIEVKWIWLKLNAFTTFCDLMHETVISPWAVLDKIIAHCPKPYFITEG